MQHPREVINMPESHVFATMQNKKIRFVVAKEERTETCVPRCPELQSTLKDKKT
jgi:hypothetical protein